MVPNDLEGWVLKVMRDELAARQADPEIRERDRHGQPLVPHPWPEKLLRVA